MKNFGVTNIQELHVLCQQVLRQIVERFLEQIRFCMEFIHLKKYFKKKRLQLESFFNPL